MDIKRNWKRVGPLAVALTLALGGCGGASPRQASTAHGGPRFYGAHPGQEPTRAHLGLGDCKRLAVLTRRRVGRPLQMRSEPTPPNSHCLLSAPGVHVSIYLDAAYAARQRYENRMTEQVQFNAPDPAKLPHPVPGLGDRSAGEHFASWIPAYNTVFAVRGNRWVTVAFSTLRQGAVNRPDAVALARAAFVFSTR